MPTGLIINRTETTLGSPFRKIHPKRGVWKLINGIAHLRLPWIPEPSTVNNKLKCREGSGI
jgi:hypothetical protein